METIARLPLLGLVGESLRDVFGNLAGLARIAWTYYALALGLVVLAWLVRETDGTAVATGWIAPMLGGGMGQVILSLAVPACIVRWHRHVIHAEALRSTAPLNGRVLRYFLWSVLLSLICALPSIAAGLLAFAIGESGAGATPYRIDLIGLAMAAAGLVLTLLLFVRLNLVLPAVSVDDRRTGLRGSWVATRGHAVPLAALFLLLLLGLGMLGAFAGLIEAVIGAIGDTAANPGREPSQAPTVTGWVLGAAVNLVAAMIAASMTARVYLRLVGAPRREPA